MEVHTHIVRHVSKGEALEHTHRHYLSVISSHCNYHENGGGRCVCVCVCVCVCEMLSTPATVLRFAVRMCTYLNGDLCHAAYKHMQTNMNRILWVYQKKTCLLKHLVWTGFVGCVRGMQNTAYKNACMQWIINKH